MNNIFHHYYKLYMEMNDNKIPDFHQLFVKYDCIYSI